MESPLWTSAGGSLWARAACTLRDTVRDLISKGDKKIL